MSRRLIIGVDDDGRRLDRILRKCHGDLPLSAIHRLLRTGRVRVDGKKALAADRLKAGSVLELPELEGLGPAIRNRGPHSAVPPVDPPIGVEGSGPLDVVWEGNGLLVLSKPAGLLVHGPRSLEDRVTAYLAGKLAPSLSFRPGPLHRLDRGTSGLVAFSTSLDGARRFSEALRARLLRKRYIALLDGEVRSAERWEDDLVRDRGDRGDRKTAIAQDRDSAGGDGEGAGAQSALTSVVPLARAGAYTLALVEIGTGRTHQIRAQAAAHAHPLAGDKKYGGSALGRGFLLHAYELASPPEAALPLPPVLVAPPPAPFLRTIERRFGTAVAEMLASGLPTDSILDAIM